MDPKLSYKYSDRIRHIYLAMAVILFVASVFFKDQLPFPSPFLVIFLLLLVIVAGFTNPKLRSVVIADLVVAIGSFIIFIGQVLGAYGRSSTLFFWASAVLALLALFNVYYTVETIREHFQIKYPFT